MSTTNHRLHDRALELAAHAIDFALDRAEAAELAAHVAACPACSRSAAALHADAAAIRQPATLLPSRRVDDAVYAAISRPEVRSQRLPVLVAATLLLLALLGVAAAGAFLLRTWPTLPIVVEPTVPAVVIDATPSASPAPSAPPALPTGTLIAYAGRVGERPVVHTVQPDGQVDQTLTEGGPPTWSPDGRSIVFGCRFAEAAAAGRLGDICVMDFDGTNIRVIVTDGISPSWSADGSRILFSRSAIDAGNTWVADADGSNAAKIGDGAGSWSPDGQWILLLGASGAAPDATIVRPDGSGARRLGDCWNATWSPDGRRIACTRWDEVHGMLRAIDLESGSVTTLLEVDVAIGDPAWITTDRLAITMARSGSSPSALPPENDLYLLDLGSGEHRQLTSSLSIAGPIAVSPDGAWVAFTAADGDATDIYLVSMAGETRRLTTTGSASRPRWQPLSPAPSPSTSPTASARPSPAPVWQSARIPPMFAGGAATPVAVAAGEQGFAAVGLRAYRDVGTPSGGTGSAWKSADGVTWEPAAAVADLAVGDWIRLSGPQAGLGDVAWGPSGFVAVGIVLDSGGAIGAAWYSADGLSWTRSELPAATLARPTAVTWNGATYVMVGIVEAKSAPRGAVWLSADGRSWRRVPDAAVFDIGGYIDTGEYHAWGGPADITAAPDGSVYAVGRTCTVGTTVGTKLPDCRPLVWRSGDGETWVRVPGDAAPGVSLVSVAASGTGVVAVGRPQWAPDGSPSVAVISSARWRLVQPAGVPRLVRVVAFGQGNLALAKAANEISLWTSPDGGIWAPVSGLPQPPDVTSLRDVDVAVAGSRVVIVGWAEVSSALGLDSFAIVWSPQ